MKKIEFDVKIGRAVAAVLADEMKNQVNRSTAKARFLRPYFEGEDAILKKTADSNRYILLASVAELLEKLTTIPMDIWTLLWAVVLAGYKIGIHHVVRMDGFYAQFVILGCELVESDTSCTEINIKEKGGEE